MIEALATIKGYYDYGIFQPIQIASFIGGEDDVARLLDSCCRRMSPRSGAWR